nr:putative reverse transcriptase domain-containing protein [Tanacetum cinerariifolium]
ALSLTQRDLKENFMTLLWNLGPRLTKIKGTHDIIQFHIGTLKTDTSNIKAMITKMVFNGTSSSTPLGSILLPTAAPSEVNAPVGGFIKPKTIVLEVPITVSSSTPKLTDPLLEVTPFETGSSSFITPKSNKGNVIDKETDSLPPKLSILDKKEKMELAAKNAELSKDELMKAAAKIVNEPRSNPLKIGHVIDCHGIHVDPPTEIHQFLGLDGYYQRFIEGFSKIAKSMTKLTQKKVKFDWGDKQETVFQLIK